MEVETNAGAAPSTPDSGQGQPVDGFKAPEGYELVKADELGTYRRYADEVKGFKPLYESLNKYGLGKLESVKQWSPFFDAVKSGGWTPAELVAALGGEATGGGGKSPQSGFDPSTFRDELLGEFRKEYESKNRESAQQAEKRLLAETASKLAGKDGDTELVEAWLERQANTQRKKYGDDHPLKGEAMPLDPDGIASLAKSWTDRAAKAKAAQMSKVAQAAGKAVPAAAGSTAAGGAPKNEDTRSPEERMLERLQRAKARLEQQGSQRATV